MTIQQRFQKSQQLGLCSNCLRSGHEKKLCKSIRTCLTCKSKHHTLLHDNVRKMSLTDDSMQVNAHQLSLQPPMPSTSTDFKTYNAALQSTSRSIKKSYIFLGTAIVDVLDVHGQKHQYRAILDSASQVNLITSRLANQLGLKRTRIFTPISGIGNTKNAEGKFQVDLNIAFRTNNFSAKLTSVILPTISCDQPTIGIDVTKWNIPANIPLADPEFNIPNRIDLLIGAELHYQLCQVGQILLAENQPVLQKTLFGWIVSGKSETIQTQDGLLCHYTTESDSMQPLHEQMKKFWELENHEESHHSWSPEEQLCESHFLKTFKLDETGRFIVRIPFNKDPYSLGDSHAMAQKRYMNLECRLHRNPELLKQYQGFIHECIQQGHMHQVEASESHYCLPHHCVLKPESSTTKLRVVFDGSAKSTSGESLNDVMMSGPVVQQDLFAILLRFRTHRYVMTADISKMYRQVNIDSRDQKFQTILWRDTPTEELRYYQLSTVTYGTTAAPYLATRSLMQLAIDEKEFFPKGATIASKDFYVDDLLTGANTIQEVRNIVSELNCMLNKGGFKLRKWCANRIGLLNDIPIEYREKYLQVQDGDTIKTLGLIWQPSHDEFQLTTPENYTYSKKPITKRSVLSDIARFFDPLGLVNPVALLGKIFMQQLWQLKLDWNESLPLEYHNRWTRFREQLFLVKELRFLRRLCLVDYPACIQIHAFADASEKAYGTCIYLRCLDKFNNISVNLITAKSRVAPLRKTTLPRLKLCAAQLAAQLVNRVTTAMDIKVQKIFHWTDSTVVLSWIAEPPSSWSTFVSNRVADIQNQPDISSWHHVPGKISPADLVSRGSLPADLFKSDLWFKGPAFLQEPEASWARNIEATTSSLPERKK